MLLNLWSQFLLFIHKTNVFLSVFRSENTSTFAQDEPKLSVKKYSNIQKQSIPKQGEYFYEKHKSHTFFTTKTQKQSWKDPYRLPNSESREIKFKPDRNKNIQDSVAVNKNDTINKINVNTTLEDLSVVINNSTSTRDISNCSTGSNCTDKELENLTECNGNCTSQEDKENFFPNMDDLELSDQPFDFEKGEIGADCTTDCGVIKEAESLCHTCHQVCHYVPSTSGSLRSVKCGCYHGYAIGPDWLHCIDIDECSVNPWLCNGGTCLNTVGSFMCRCRPGYQLIGHMCVDIDECTKNKGLVGMCDQVCINVPGTYQCWCHKGFTLSMTDPRSCVDINECESSVCSHNCSNTVGSFVCTCPVNMILHADGRTCVLRKELQDRNLGIDLNSKNIIIDGNRRIVIYGNGSSHQMYGDPWSDPELRHQNKNTYDRTSNSSANIKNGTDFHSVPPTVTSDGISSTSVSQRTDHLKEHAHIASSGHKTGTQGLANVSAAFASQPDIVAIKMDGNNHILIQKNQISSQRTFKACIPACKNGGICDGRRKCHCRKGFQGRYCQIDVNECSTDPTLCIHVCVNTFGSYQCLCPSGYTISSDRKTCTSQEQDYSAVIVLISPDKTISQQTLQPSSKLELGRVGGYRRMKTHNKLSIENLHTTGYLESTKHGRSNDHSAISSSMDSEVPYNELRPTATLQRDLKSGNNFIVASQMPEVNFGSDRVDSAMEQVEDIVPSSVSYDHASIVPTATDIWGKSYKDKGHVLDTLFSFILGPEPAMIDVSRYRSMHQNFRSILEPTKPMLISANSNLMSSSNELFVSELAPTATLPSNLFLMTHIIRNNSLDSKRTDNKTEMHTSVNESRNNVTDTRRDHKGKGKKTKKLNHREDKQRTKKEKERKLLRNRTLRKGRIKLVRLTKDFQVLHQILDASRDSFRAQDSNVPHVSKQRAETDWSTRDTDEENTMDSYNSGTEDRYFEVIDYDDDNFNNEPSTQADPFAPAPLTLPTNDLPVWNQSRKQELDCFYKKQVIKSRMSIYRDERNCTQCICKSGRAVCEDVRCHALDCPQQYQVIVPDQCCPVCLPPEPGCFYKGRFFYQGQLWVRKEGGCQACLCRDGEVQCNPVVCVVDCQHPQFVPGECCPLCEGCQHYNRKYENQEIFPHPSDTCSVCHCQQGNVTCRPGACAADCIIRGKPIPSGAEFHIGSDTCTQCRCWNGTVSCHAVECDTICSHGVLLPHKCCLDCTKCDYQGQLYSEMQVFRPDGDNCKSCLCVKGNVMCQDTCNTSPPKH
ncbi:hypothetical protein C0J52_15456 [Blattella germanica]|nr:hypothetical protein C0J52_15456 [Blattella germanica]